MHLPATYVAASIANSLVVVLITTGPPIITNGNINFKFKILD